MKKFFVMFAIATALVACNDSASSTTEKKDSNTAAPATNDSNMTAPATPVNDSNMTAPAAGDSVKPAGDSAKTK